MLLDSLWPLVLVAAGCACVISAALAYDAGHSKGFADAKDIYGKWLEKWI